MGEHEMWNRHRWRTANFVACPERDDKEADIFISWGRELKPERPLFCPYCGTELPEGS